MKNSRYNVQPKKFSEPDSDSASTIGGQSRLRGPALITWMEMMASLLQAGMQIPHALQLCSRMQGSAAWQNSCKKLHLAIDGGQDFAEAARSVLPDLPPLASGMLGIGQHTGKLAPVLQELSAFLRQTQTLKQKTGRVMVYPSIIFVLVILGSLGLLLFVMPQFIAMATQIGGSSGADLLAASNRLGTTLQILVSFFALIIVTTVFGLLLKQQNRTAAIKLDAMILRLPTLGKFMAWQETLRFSWSLELLLDAGMDMAQALKQAQNVVKNAALKSDIQRICMEVHHGKSLSQAFFRSRFPALARQWLVVGETTGQATAVFRRIRLWCQGQSEAWIESLNSLIEPISTLLVGFIVLLFVLGFILPLFSLYGGI